MIKIGDIVVESYLRLSWIAPNAEDPLIDLTNIEDEQVGVWEGTLFPLSYYVIFSHVQATL